MLQPDCLAFVADAADLILARIWPAVHHAYSQLLRDLLEAGRHVEMVHFGLWRVGHVGIDQFRHRNPRPDHAVRSIREQVGGQARDVDLSGSLRLRLRCPRCFAEGGSSSVGSCERDNQQHSCVHLPINLQLPRSKRFRCSSPRSRCKEGSSPGRLPRPTWAESEHRLHQLAEMLPFQCR